MTDRGVLQAQYFEDIYQLLQLRGENLDSKIDAAIRIGCDRLGVENGVVTHTTDGQYEVLESSVPDGEYSAGSVTELATTWCRHVVDEESPLAFDDANETDYADDIAHEETGLTCYIGVPLVVDGETYGTLCFSNDEPRGEEFSEIDRQFVTILAEWVSYEIERTHHHRELAAQNERLDEFTGIVAHDLRNPLTAATGYTEILLDGLEGEQAEYAEIVAENLDRMESLIDGLLLLAKQGLDVGDRSPVELESVARTAWETIQTRDATLELDTERTVYADASRLQQVFENLFRNAVEHCPPGVTVSVSDSPEGFCITDDGDGISADLLDSLFDRDEVGNEQRGGLGLLIVERVVRGHGWTIAVESDESGTRFQIENVVWASPTGASSVSQEA
jgi:two-component system OmpR family sensor kinase